MPGGALEMETSSSSGGTGSGGISGKSAATASNAGTVTGTTLASSSTGGASALVRNTILSSSYVFVGRKLDEHRGAFYLEHPMDKGAVTPSGWDAMERLWEVRESLGH
jgi:hypothetical protein